MVTIVSGPRNDDGMSGGAGVVIGAGLVLLVLIVVIVYALPYVRDQFNSMSNPTIQVELPKNMPSFPTPTPAPSPAPSGTTTAQ